MIKRALLIGTLFWVPDAEAADVTGASQIDSVIVFPDQAQHP